MAATFQELLAWQRAHELMLFVHRRIMPILPSCERRDLVDQIRRSSKSVPSNIAEGHGRFYFKEAIRYCHTARGSLSETQNHLRAARDLQYIPLPLYDEARQLAEDAYRLLNGYISYLKRAQPGKNEPGHDIPPHMDTKEQADTNEKNESHDPDA